MQSPNIKDGASPLEQLIYSSVRRFGDFAPAINADDAAQMFVEFANSIVDDVNTHPNYKGDPIPYYVHISESRDIPDNIVIAGLYSYYCEQQGSAKLQTAYQRYMKTLNSLVYYTSYGNEPVSLKAYDR